jgi:NADH-quinone oxidoreductase subunit A
MLTDFGRVLAFLLVAILFVAVVMFVARLLRPHRPSRDKLQTYECGEEPVGEPWVKFNIRFYVVALIFVIFDVEVVFLFPWATVLSQLGWFAFIEMMVFIGMLLVGLAYVWAKGDLEWDKPQPQIPRLQSARGGQPAEKTLVGEQEEVTV